MKVWIDKDLPVYKVGDLVWSKYHKNEVVYRITNIDRRFIVDTFDARQHQYVFPGCEVGDEYNPYITVEAVMDLSIKADSNKKMRKSSKGLDASWLLPVTSQHIQAHIKRLNDLITTQFP